MLLTDRVVLITGPKRIGAVLAGEVASRGADVAVTYNRSKAEADEAVAAIDAIGRRAIAVQADLSDADTCTRVVQETVNRLGRLDVLVNMASVYRSTPFRSLSGEAWDAALAVDLTAALLCARAAAPHMSRAGGGRIINFSDWLPASGRPRYEGYAAYYVAKSGVIALTEALALELAADQILVNAIAPGPILPPPDVSADEIAAVEKATPLRRWGGEQEIVKAVLFLIDTDFVTGEVVRVDGGRHLN
ncbi:MAG: SDR family oxidoreductase [Acidobacteriota bacterium]